MLSVCPVLIYLRTNGGLPRDTIQRRADNNFYKQNKDKNSVVAGLIIAAVKWHKINDKLTETEILSSVYPQPRPSPGRGGSCVLVEILPPVVTSNQDQDSGLGRLGRFPGFSSYQRNLNSVSPSLHIQPPVQSAVTRRGVFINDLLINMLLGKQIKGGRPETSHIYIV